MRSRNISCSTIIQNMAQIKELYKDSWETIPGNSDTLLYLGGNEASTHKYISEALGKSTIDTKTHGQTKGAVRVLLHQLPDERQRTADAGRGADAG